MHDWNHVGIVPALVNWLEPAMDLVCIAHYCSNIAIQPGFSFYDRLEF